jgi:hypothetical protein
LIFRRVVVETNVSKGFYPSLPIQSRTTNNMAQIQATGNTSGIAQSIFTAIGGILDPLGGASYDLQKSDFGDLKIITKHTVSVAPGADKTCSKRLDSFKNITRITEMLVGVAIVKKFLVTVIFTGPQQSMTVGLSADALPSAAGMMEVAGCASYDHRVCGNASVGGNTFLLDSTGAYSFQVKGTTWTAKPVYINYHVNNPTSTPFGFVITAELDMSGTIFSTSTYKVTK